MGSSIAFDVGDTFTHTLISETAANLSRFKILTSFDKIRKHVVKCIGKTSCASGFLENGNDSIGKIKRKYVDALIHN